MNKHLSLLYNILRGKFIPFLVPFWDEHEKTVINEWFRGRQFPGSIEELENSLAAQYGNGMMVRSVNLGRAALQLALQSLRLKPYTEVILPSFGCIGTIMPVIQSGHIPVLVDCDNHYNIRLESIQEAHSDKIRAIILPHLSGYWAEDTEDILKWARSKNIYVIEDCAQSLNLNYKGQFAGTFGDVGIFSCHSGKQIMNSAGAWIITKNKELGTYIRNMNLPVEQEAFTYRRVKEFYHRFHLSWYPSIYLREAAKMKFFHNRFDRAQAEDYSFDSYSLSEIEAKLLVIQMRKIDMITLKRRQHAAFWRQQLNKMGLESVRFLPENNNVATKMLLAFEGEGANRESDYLRSTLTRNAIETEGSYHPLHLMNPFANVRRTKMPFTDRLWKNAFSVPVRPNLSVDDLERFRMATYL